MPRVSLYKTVRWFKLRSAQLKAHPFCRMCLEKGKTVKATVCDHVERHNGDEQKFWAGPFQSLCQTCHSLHKQRMELGMRPKISIGEDGWPIDPPGGLMTASTPLKVGGEGSKI